MRSLRNASFVVLLGLVVAFGPGLSATSTPAAASAENICLDPECDCYNQGIYCEYYQDPDNFCWDAWVTCRDYLCEGQVQYFTCDDPEWPEQSATCVCKIEGRR